MKRYFYIIAILSTGMYSCQESAEISIQNKVHNASLENIYFGDYSVSYSLYPGQTSSKFTISDDKDDWPKMSQVEFFMVRDGNRVYLKTKASFRLNIDDDLLIVIADTTEVESPLGKKSIRLNDIQ